jgi:hypothetical protein
LIVVPPVELDERHLGNTGDTSLIEPPSNNQVGASWGYSGGNEHNMLLLDQVGWHGAKALTVPACVTLVQLPPRSLELNPAARPGGIEQDGRMTSLTSYPRIEDCLTN